MDNIKAKKEALQEKAMQLGAKMYENVNKGEENQAENNNETKSDNVSDAEYEEK